MEYLSDSSNSDVDVDEVVPAISISVIRRNVFEEDENQIVDVEFVDSSSDVVVDDEIFNRDSDSIVDVEYVADDARIDIAAESNIAQEPNLIPSLEASELGVENPIVRLENPHYTPDAKKEEVTKSSESHKRSYSEMEGDDDNGQNCPVCLEQWTSAGDHRLCSLKCGHLFGKSCVLRWLSTRTRAACPQCNSKTRKSDIRELYANKVVAVDTTELEELRQTCAKIKQELKEMEDKLIVQKTMTQYYKKLNDEMMDSNAAVSVPIAGPLFNSIQMLKYKSLFSEKLEEDSSRVVAYSCKRDLIVLSQKSSSPLWPGFGIRILSPKDWVISGYHHLHKKIIRDLSFHPENTEEVLSVGFDNSAKVFDVVSKSLSLSFSSGSPLWCCLWDPVHPNFLYCGAGNGDIILFNVHSPNDPFKLEKGPTDNVPVVALHKSTLHGFILCCRSLSVTAYFKESLLNFRRQVLDVGTGPFSAMTYEDSRGIMVLACRPKADQASQAKHICYRLTLDGGQLRTERTHEFHAGSSATRIFRPSILATPTRCLYFAFNESCSAIWGWCLESKSKVISIDVNKPVMDLLAVLRENDVYLVILTTASLKCYLLT